MIVEWAARHELKHANRSRMYRRQVRARARRVALVCGVEVRLGGTFYARVLCGVFVCVSCVCFF